MPDKKDSTTHGAVFQLRRGEKVVVTGPDTEVQITYEGKARDRGNRASIRVRASDGMELRVAKGGTNEEENG